MEIQGQIIVIGETQVVGQKGFRKRQLVIKTDAQYPQSIPVEFTQDKTGLLDLFKIGDFVTIGINVQGSEWQGKYYCNLNGWKISKGEKEKSASSFMPDRVELVGDMANQFNESQMDDDNDLPF
jgi:hypothetical protein